METVHEATPRATKSDNGNDSWSELDPLVKFGVAVAALMFLGVIIEGVLLTPWTLALYGWIPGPR